MSTRLLHKGTRSTVTAAAAAANNVRGPKTTRGGGGGRNQGRWEGGGKRGPSLYTYTIVIGGMCDSARNTSFKTRQKLPEKAMRNAPQNYY